MSHDSSCMQNDPYECHPILIRDDALQLGFIRDVSKIRLNNVHIWNVFHQQRICIAFKDENVPFNLLLNRNTEGNPLLNWFSKSHPSDLATGPPLCCWKLCYKVDTANKLIYS